jgi:hypothetical protein
MLSLRSYMSEQGCLCISRLFAATKYRLAGQLVVSNCQYLWMKIV